MIDITMDKVVPDKSSDDVTGISQNKKRPTRHKKTVKNKGKPTVKSPEISGRILIVKFIILYIIIVGS